jgi:hypothetical protein
MKNIQNWKRFNESFLSKFYNKNLINQIENCNSADELFSIIKDMYPDTRNGKDGYDFNFINSSLENWIEVKESLLSYLSKKDISDIIIYGPSQSKPGRRWMFSTSYMLMH